MEFSPEAKKKAIAIMAWYKHEAPGLSVNQRLALLKSWIDTCISHEEYEMAIALRKTRCNLIKKLRKAKGADKGIVDCLLLIFKIYSRGFKRTKIGKSIFKK